MRTFYHYFLPNRKPVAQLVPLVFKGTNKFGGDQTLFVDKVEVLDDKGALVNAGLVNADFSYPRVGNGYFAYLSGNYDPLLGWTFVGLSGIATTGSAFGPPPTPDGNASMIIQDRASVSQNMRLLPGRYRMRFLSAQREDTQFNTMEVYAGATRIMAEFGPTQLVGFQPYLTDYFTVA